MVSPFQPGTIWVSRRHWGAAGEPPIKPGDIFMVVELIARGGFGDHIRVLKGGRTREIFVQHRDAVPCNEQPAVV
jgi:hypothetical protein